MICYLQKNNQCFIQFYSEFYIEMTVEIHNYKT